jgi:hypothetical protein
LLQNQFDNVVYDLNEILKTENIRFSTKIVKISENDNETHEILITTQIDGVFKNLNQVFIEKKFAKYTNDKTLMIQLSDELLDKFKKQEELNSPHNVMRPLMPSKPTFLDLEVNEILKNFDKTFKTVLIDRKNSNLRHRFTVTNCISPNEIWIGEAYNYEENLKGIHGRLNEIYSCIEADEESTLDDWQVNGQCVWRHSSYHSYKRGKIVQKNFANNTVKVN